jgi:hypothetical protein
MAKPEYLAEMREKVHRRSKGLPIHIKFHNADRSFIEAALTRGDRRQGRALEEAWTRGSKFEAWDECYSTARWREAFAAAGLDPAWYAHREIPRDEVLPWDHIDVGAPKAWLKEEAERARAVTVENPESENRNTNGTSNPPPPAAGKA